MTELYDTIIIGGASAGLTAAIYAKRRKMKTLVITKDVGGQALENSIIENYQGFLKVSGPKLMQRFQKQTVKFDTEIVVDEVKHIEESNDEFTVKS